MKLFNYGLALLIACVGLVVHDLPSLVLAQSTPLVNGIIVGIETNDNDQLITFVVSDSTGTLTTFKVSDSTKYGLENQAGDRWVTSNKDGSEEAARRLSEHQESYVPITVSYSEATEDSGQITGIATSVVDREQGKLETNLGYIFAVFAITWILFFAYIFYMGRKQKVVQYEITQIKASLQ